MFINIVFRLGSDRPSGLFSFVPVLLLSILTPLFLPSASVSLSYFILAVLLRQCLEHSFPIPIAILNSTFFFAKRDDLSDRKVACRQLTIIIIIIIIIIMEVLQVW